MIKRNRPKIYLAGGFRSGWQNTVMQQLPGFEFLDPSKHEIAKPVDYVNWDLQAIRKCDLVFANMEATNPGGYALALEIGYAKALRKTILLVEEHPDSVREKYFEMVREVADVRVPYLEDAVNYLRDKYRSA